MEIQQGKNAEIVLSIIVPVYNTSLYLTECLESLCDTKIENVEFICIDDGSTDDSLTILRSFSKKDSRFKVITKDNEGYGKTMNLGLELAKGEYIGILESDDTVAPGAYCKLVSAAKDLKADIIKGNTRFVSNDGFQDSEMYNGFPHYKIIDPKEYIEVFTAGLSHWSGIYRREFLIDNKIRYNATPGASFQDYSFYYLALMCTERMAIIPDNIINYRIDNSDSSIHDRKKVFAICYECDFLKHEMEKRNLPDILYGLEPLLRFHAYDWNIKRLTYYYKFQFLDRFNKEFANLIDNNRINEELWDDVSAQKLQILLNNPEKYFLSLIPITWEELTDSYHKKLFEYGKKGILEELKTGASFYIYGAGNVGKKILRILEDNGIDIDSRVKGFLVTDTSENSKEVLGIPIIGVNDLSNEERNKLVIIAVGKKYCDEVKSILNKQHYKNVIVVDEFFYEFFD